MPPCWQYIGLININGDRQNLSGRGFKAADKLTQLFFVDTDQGKPCLLVGKTPYDGGTAPYQAPVITTTRFRVS